MNTVFIVCGVHNNLDKTKKLLESIKIQTYTKIKTVIIDDDSTDQTSDYIKKNHPEISIITGNGKLFWTGALFEGINFVLKSCRKEDFILTVNNDCTFERDYVRILVTISQKNPNTIIGSLVVDSKDKVTIHDAGVKIEWKKGKFVQLGPKYLSDLPKNINYQDNIDTLTTKGTIYSIPVFYKIGNFDKTHLPHYVSDYEFGCRAKKNGYKLILSYRARVYNDIKNTGFGENIPSRINITQFIDLLFSRRSRINIVDRFWFISLCCPNKYKIWNYLLLIGKIFYLFHLLFPASFLRVHKKNV